MNSAELSAYSMNRLVHLGIYKGGAQLDISAGTQGEYGQQVREYLGSSFALDVKGGERLGKVVAIKSKGGIVGIMMHVLYLMETPCRITTHLYITR